MKVTWRAPQGSMLRPLLWNVAFDVVLSGTYLRRGSYLRAMAEKTQRVINALGRLMSNVGVSSENRKCLFALHVVVWCSYIGSFDVL